MFCEAPEQDSSLAALETANQSVSEVHSGAASGRTEFF